MSRLWEIIHTYHWFTFPFPGPTRRLPRRSIRRRRGVWGRRRRGRTGRQYENARQRSRNAARSSAWKSPGQRSSYMSALYFKTRMSQRKHVSFFTSGNKWTSSLRINCRTFEDSGSKFQEYVFSLLLSIAELTFWNRHIINCANHLSLLTGIYRCLCLQATIFCNQIL